jgi:4-amino-4-deoxy-L-arabinose transferase-like glycosyltransferase
MSARRPTRPTSAPTAAEPAVSPPWSWPVRVVTALALLYPLAFLGVALLRLGYPYELEWMEGSMVHHVDRVRAGLPLYVEPSLAFTPFIYPPVYFWVAAAATGPLGSGFVPLRLVSILATLACLALLYLIVRRDSRSRLPAVLAACLFAATYREGGAWFDLGRVDMLGFAFLLGGVLALRAGGNRLALGAAAGALFALSALTKQSALLVAAAAAAGLALADRARLAGFLAGFAAPLGLAAWGIERASGGWFRYYIVDLPRDHPIIGQLLRGFWITDLLGPAGVALTIGAVWFFAGDGARARWRDLGLVAGLILTGYLTRIRVGSFDNVVIPSYLGVSLAFGLGLAALVRLRDAAPPHVRRRGERLVAFLVLAQFALLAYKPWQQVPTREEKEAGGQIVESLRRLPGEVWIPSHPYLAVLAGKPAHAHELALMDVLRSREDTPVQRALMDSLHAAVRAQRYSAVVLDGEGWPKDLSAPYYELKAHMFREEEKTLFWSETGYYTRPDFVYLPRDTTK